MSDLNIYGNNADIKFPLIDTHTENIPNDILTGLSLSVPAGINAQVTGIRVGSGYAFIVIEDVAQEIAVAYVRVDDPIPGMIYPLEMDIDGHGFVMFGPGVIDREGYFSGNIAVDIEPENLTVLVVQPTVWSITSNGLSYDLSNVLSILSKNDLVKVTISGNNLYIDRNDVVMDELTRATFINRTIGNSADPRIFTIAGVGPDDTGNIDIDIESCIERCADVNSVIIPRGDGSSAEQQTLPLDIFFPAVPNPEDPCAPEIDPEEEETTIEDTCHSIDKEVIFNEDSIAIGTLYTPAGSPFVFANGDGFVFANGDDFQYANNVE